MTLFKDKPVKLEYHLGLTSPKLRAYIWQWIEGIQKRHPHGRVHGDDGKIGRTISWTTYDRYHRRDIARELRVHRLRAEGMSEEGAVAKIRTKLSARAEN